MLGSIPAYGLYARNVHGLTASNLRFQTATGVLENSARLRHAKREIARILTVKHEREPRETS